MIVLAAIVVLSSGAFAGPRRIPSADRLPRGNWTYDAMINLAAAGLVPGYAARVFEGDRIFNRIEMAEIIDRIIASAEGSILSPDKVGIINKLALEFRPELAEFAPEALEDWSERSAGLAVAGGAMLMGYVQSALDKSTVTDDGRTIVPYRISGFANLSGRAFGLATWADREEKFLNEFRNESTLAKVLIKGFDENFIWEIGRDYLHWGPAYSGSLILSDNSAGFVQAQGIKEIDFGKLLGRLKITQFTGTFEDRGERLYLFGRRYERPLSRRWYVGISETAKTSRAPNPLILVLPFYLYQHLFLDIDEEFNTLYSADLLFRNPRGQEFYGELLIDDITAPRIFGDRFDRPRKTGYLLGFHLPKAFGSAQSSFRAEYIFIDPLTYSATRDDLPELAYIHDTDVIGHPIGPNAKGIYLRAEHYFNEKFSTIIEYLDQRPTDPGITDTGAPMRGTRKVLSAQLAYDIRPGRSITVRIAPFESETPTGDRGSGTAYSVRASLSF